MYKHEADEEVLFVHFGIIRGAIGVWAPFTRKSTGGFQDRMKGDQRDEIDLTVEITSLSDGDNP